MRSCPGHQAVPSAKVGPKRPTALKYSEQLESWRLAREPFTFPRMFEEARLILLFGDSTKDWGGRLMVVYCSRCRKGIDRETFNFWQGTAWCGHCRTVVSGSFSKVPMWVVGMTLFMALRLGIY